MFTFPISGAFRVFFWALLVGAPPPAFRSCFFRPRKRNHRSQSQSRHHRHMHYYRKKKTIMSTDDNKINNTECFVQRWHHEIVLPCEDHWIFWGMTGNKTELAALVKTLDKVKDLKATKVAEYGKACSVPDSCTSKAKKLAYLLGESLDRLRWFVCIPTHSDTFGNIRCLFCTCSVCTPVAQRT